MKLAIVGSRGFEDYERLNSAVAAYFSFCEGVFRVTEVVSGGARGADSLAARWAKENGVKLTEFKPDWETHGKRAGFLRNEDIVKAADVVLAFWGIDPKTGELSKGTQHSIGLAKKMKKTTVIVYV